MSAGDQGKAFQWGDYFVNLPLEWLAEDCKAGRITVETYVLYELETHQWTIETPDGPRIIGGMDQATLAARIGRKPGAIYDAVKRLKKKGLIAPYKPGQRGSYALYILRPDSPLPPIKEPNKNSGRTSRRPAQQLEGPTPHPPQLGPAKMVQRKNARTI